MNNELWLSGGGGITPPPSGYNIERSVRFNSADSAYLSRTPASAGNRKTWTLSLWVKRCKLGVVQSFTSSNNNTILLFDSNDKLCFYQGAYVRVTTQVFRDCSAWYHILLAVDTTNATAQNRARIYVNGDEITTWTTNTTIAQDLDTNWNAALAHQINSNNNSQYGDLYIADVYSIDGQALDPTSFGEFDSNGVWQPKAYTGSYGTNGFHLPFSDNSTAAALGTDTSGNGNDWTVNNISADDGGQTSIAAASGALPIYNTTDTYGTVKGTGTRTDSNSSSIVLAVAMDGANNGTTFTDESATIKGSGSAKTITRNGDAKTSTTQSKYYGSSGYFDGTGDYLSNSDISDFNFGTGDFTIEYWVYHSSAGSNEGYADTGTSLSTGNTGQWYIFKNSSNKVLWGQHGAAPLLTSLTSIASQTWTHVAVCRASSTVKMYVDGILDAQSTDSVNYNNGGTLRIGAVATPYYLNGYIQDFRVYKGVAKYTSNFTPPTSTQNTTVAVGCDSLVDSPTNYGTDTGVGGEVRGNYATANPLDKTTGNGIILANGNLDVTLANANVNGTIGIPSSGKWYFEWTINSFYDASFGISGGVVKIGTNAFCGVTPTTNNPGNSGGIYKNGSKVETVIGLALNDVFAVAIDMDTLTLQVYRNGSTYGSSITIDSALYIPHFRGNGNNIGDANSASINFGQRPFAYAAPSGFKALCTANLPTPTIADGSTAMDVALYTGNGSTQTISGLGFSPDLVWQKSRTLSGSAGWHSLVDSVRGVLTNLASNATDNEYTYASETLTAFNSDGFDVAYGTGWKLNASSQTYVSWCWDAGSSTVTNTDGSITSQVRANPSAGFSIVTYTGNGTGGATVGHGLGVAPSFYVVKRRDTTGNWNCYHVSLGATKGIELNLANAATTSAIYWNNASPTSTVFSLGSGPGVNSSGSTYVAYCFAPVEGYSAFGSYTGNGSADGPFVYTGFRPRFILVKNTVTTENWWITDSARDTYNVAQDYLAPNLSSAEGSSAVFDFLSNGFKVRTNFTSHNGNTHSIIYAAFAEHPFQSARAR